MATEDTESKNLASQVDQTIPEFQIQAIAPDHLHDITKLEQLFRAYHEERGEGAIAPELPVIKSEGDDLTEADTVLSLVVRDEERFVAHIAVRFESQLCTELIFPAILNQYRRHSFEISRLIWDHLMALAERQGWQTIYQFTPASESCLQIISTKCFDSFETALLPDNRLGFDVIHDGTQLHPRHHALLLMFHCFHRLQSEKTSATYLYPPLRHDEKVRELLCGAELQRIIVEEDSSSVAARSYTTRDANGSGVEVRFRSTCSTLEITVKPSELTNFNLALRQIEQEVDEALKHRSRSYVLVALDDHLCPHFCRKLEEVGYRFFGVFPVVDGRDWMLYTKFENSLVDDVSLYTPRARLLRDYILGV